MLKYITEKEQKKQKKITSHFNLHRNANLKNRNKKEMSVSRPQEDTYIHKGLRRELVQIIREQGIKDKRVLEALGRLPRHFFTDSALLQRAYEDFDFPIANGIILGRPFIAAQNLQLLEVNEYDDVLEIGTGSCYQACLMAEMHASVYTIEKDRESYNMVSHYFFLGNYPSISRFIGEGKYGLPTYAPFDKIIINAPIKQIPPKILEQLKPGGTIVYTINDGTSTKLMSLTKE